MSKMVLGLDIEVKKTGNGFEVVGASVRGLKEGVREANTSAEGLLSTIGRIGAAIGAAGAAWKAFDVLKDLISKGFEFNSQMEQSRLGLAAIIGQFAEIRDRSGNVLTDFNAQMRVATDLQEKLKVLALQTTAEYSDLVTALQSSLGPGLKAFAKESGDVLQKVLNFTQSAALAWGAMGRDMSMLPQEMRALLKGEAGPDNELVNMLFSDKIGKGGGLQAYIKQLQDAGKYSEELSKRMESFTKMGKYAGDTLAGSWSNLKDAFTQALGSGTQGQLGRVTQMFKDLTSQIVTFDEQGHATFNENFVKSIERVGEAFVFMGSKVVAAISKFDALVLKWQAYQLMLDDIDLGVDRFGTGRPDTSDLYLYENYLVAEANRKRQESTIRAREAGRDLMRNGIPGDTVPVGNRSIVGFSPASFGPVPLYAGAIKTSPSTPFPGITEFDGFKQGLASFQEQLGKFATEHGDKVKLLFDELVKVGKDGKLTYEEWATATKKVLESDYSVKAKGVGATVDAKAEKKAERIKQMLDDLTKSTDIFVEAQKKLANDASFDRMIAAEQAALQRLSASRELHAEQFQTAILREHNEVKKLELERSAALRDLADQADEFAAQQRVQLLQYQAQLQAYDDELSQFLAKQDKELQDLMQKGVAFGSDDYKKVLAEQQRALDAFLDAQKAKRALTNDEIKQLEAALTAFQQVQAAQRQRVNAESDHAISDETFAQLTERVDAYREFHDEVLRMTRSFTQRMRDSYKALADEMGQSLRRGLSALLEGGDAREALSGLVSVLHEGMAEAFGGLFDKFFATMAAHAQGQPGPGEVGPPSPSQRRNGVIGMTAIQAGAALYGLYTNPAPKQSQNIMSGALSGASIGASIGGPYAWLTAIIGGVLGGIAGAFAPSEKGKSVRIGGSGGRVLITGMDSDWGAVKLKRELDKAIRGTADKLDDIFLSLPTAALEAMGNWRPDLSKIDISGKADGKNWNEELDNYLKQTLPQRVFALYDGAFQGLLKFADVSDQRIKEFASQLKTLSTDEAIQAVKDYVEVLYGLRELADMWGGPQAKGKQRAVGKGASSWETYKQNVYQKADAGPLAEFDDIVKRVGILSQGFDDLTHDEQVSRGKQILSLSQQFFQGIETYLLRLREEQRAMNDSVDAQIRSFDYDQLKDPAKQVDFVLKRQRELYDQLKDAPSSGDVNRIMQEMQQNATLLYNLLGATPDAAAQAKAELEEARRIANERFDVFDKEAKAKAETMFGLVGDVLNKLGKGLDELFGGDPIGGGAGGPGSDPERPDVSPEVGDLGAAASTAAAAFATALTPSIQQNEIALRAATAAVVSFSEALAARTAPNVDVHMGPTAVSVDVTTNGGNGAAEQTSSAVARTTAAAMERVVVSQQRRDRRFAATGRRR